MQTQVTQKKVLRLRSTPGVSETGGEEAPPAPDTLPPPPMEYEAPGESFTWAAIVAIVAVLCFVTLLAMQWIEHQDLSSAFPMKQAVSAAR